MGQFSIIRLVIDMNIGTRIMNLRREKRLTQVDLAELLDISYMTVRRWETGKSTPTLGQIERMTEIFNVPAQYLIGLRDDTQTQTDTLKDTHAVNTPLTAGTSSKNIVIRDTNTHQEIEIPNDAEGHKLFMQLFSGLFSGFGRQNISNTINGNNNNANQLGVFHEDKGQVTATA